MIIQELLTFFTSKYPNLVQDMKNSDHGNEFGLNPFHMEGDIFTHSIMVLKEAENAQDIHKYAAILHDIGKPYVREVVDTKTRFFNHDPVSGFLALDIMKDLNLDQLTKEKLFKLICLHTDAFRLTKEQQAEKYHDYGLQKLVLGFGNYDSRGRICLDERVTDFDTNPLAYKPNINPNKGKTVTMLVGLPYSGKSTYTSGLMTSDEVFVVSRDQIVMNLMEGQNYNDAYKNVDQDMVNIELQKEFKQAKLQDNVVVDMTHMSTKSRRRSLSHFGKDWTKKCIVFLPPLTEIIKRSEIRLDKKISQDVLFDMIKRFSPPLEGEGFHNIEYRFE